MSDFWRGYLLYACCAVVAAGLVMIAVGCGLSAADREQAALVRWAHACEQNHLLCQSDAYNASLAEADLQAPPQYQPGPQRVFIRRWQTPGQYPDPRPLGYFDVY